MVGYNAIIGALFESLRGLLSDPTWVLVAACALLFYTLASCRIVSKAGFHGALGLLMLVPGLNLLLYVALALAPWPARSEARRLRRLQKAVHRADVRDQRRSNAA